MGGNVMVLGALFSPHLLTIVPFLPRLLGCVPEFRRTDPSKAHATCRADAQSTTFLLISLAMLLLFEL